MPPPHRSVRAELPHTAPTLSIWRQSKRSLTHPSQSIRRELPALRPVRGFVVWVPLGQRPSLHQLRWTTAPLFVNFSGTILLSDSSGEPTTGVRLLTFPVVSAMAASEQGKLFPEVSRF